MTKLLGFLTDQRKEPGYRPKEERLKDFQPVEKMLTDDELHRQVGRCMECGTPFCFGTGCTVANVIPEINELAYQGRWKEALELLLETNPFPEITGRICPALCEASCVAGLCGEPVAIRQMELSVAENGYKMGYMDPNPPEKRRAGKVAVIGSGPAGLTVAEVLNKMGYQITVYDEAAKPGGILRYGIPNFKLDKTVVRRRIRIMKEEGITFEMKVTVGDDISYRFLEERYDVVCLCNGARDPRDLPVPGRELQGIHFAMDFLTCQNKKDAGEYVDPADDISATGKSVVVIGGGDTGSDCLGTSLRQGARQVYQFEIMPKPPEERAENNPWPEWPRINRESSSHKEGGDRRWCVSTKEFSGENGQVKRLKAVEIEWVNEEGRFRPVEKDGTEFEVEADLVLLAMGFVGPAKNRMVNDLGLEKDPRGNVKVNAKHQTSVENIFAAGDMVSGQSLVVRAIADGMETAKSIQEYLEKKGGRI
jgi:glutamate synthase (NADPH/NADH) small chain